MLNITLAVLLILLQLADAYTTMVVINQGGREANPIQHWLSEHLPGKWTWLIVTKGLYCVLIAVVGMIQHWVVTLALVTLCGLYVWVVVHNIGEMRG